MLARLPSIWSCSRRRTSMAAFQSRSRRQLRNAIAIALELWQIFLGNACVQRKQDAIEAVLIAYVRSLHLWYMA